MPARGTMGLRPPTNRGEEESPTPLLLCSDGAPTTELVVGTHLAPTPELVVGTHPNLTPESVVGTHDTPTTALVVGTHLAPTAILVVGTHRAPSVVPAIRASDAPPGNEATRWYGGGADGVDGGHVGTGPRGGGGPQVSCVGEGVLPSRADRSPKIPRRRERGRAGIVPFTLPFSLADRSSAMLERGAGGRGGGVGGSQSGVLWRGNGGGGDGGGGSGSGGRPDSRSDIRTTSDPDVDAGLDGTSSSSLLTRGVGGVQSSTARGRRGVLGPGDGTGTGIARVREEAEFSTACVDVQRATALGTGERMWSGRCQNGARGWSPSGCRGRVSVSEREGGEPEIRGGRRRGSTGGPR